VSSLRGVTTASTELARRLARPWRAVFVLWALVVTLATHWPSLEVGSDTFPAPDKIVHMITFGSLVVLLRRTRWIARLWPVGLIVLAWTVLDELTQSLPVLDRTFSAQDVAAGQIGVAVALAWYWALSPIGGPANRARLGYRAFVVDDLLARPGAWIVVAGAGAGGAVVVGAATGLIAHGAGAGIMLPTSIMAGGFAGGVAASTAALAEASRRRGIVLGDVRPCFACGNPCGEVAVADDGRGDCPACRTSFHAGQWAPPMLLPLRVAARGTIPAILAGGAILLGALAIYGLVLGVSIHLTAAQSLLRGWHALLPDMQLVVDMALIAVALAVSVRVYRRRQAPLYDGQHRCCRCCDHLLAGAVVTRGTGRCSECGTMFARFSDD